MNRIIKIKSLNEDIFKITLRMTSHCPYSCRYCPDHLHEGKHTKLNLEDISLFLDRFTNKQVVFNITGGEPTTHPQFIDLLKIIKNKNAKIIVDTNAVRTPDFFKKKWSFG